MKMNYTYAAFLFLATLYLTEGVTVGGSWFFTEPRYRANLSRHQNAAVTKLKTFASRVKTLKSHTAHLKDELKQLIRSINESKDRQPATKDEEEIMDDEMTFMERYKKRALSRSMEKRKR